MKKLFYFMIICFSNIFISLYSKIAYAGNEWQSLYGVSVGRTFKNVRTLFYLLGIILILSWGIVSLYKKFRKFDYKTSYLKFKPKDKVKITFVDEGKVVTKKAKLISISSKSISFEDKENVYECVPSEIKNIRKRSKKFLITVLLIWLIVSVVDFISSFIARNMYEPQSLYGVEFVTDYGLEFDD